MIIDTHCHLDDGRYREDIDPVLRNAWEHDVKGFILPGADPKDLPRAVVLCEQYDHTFFAVGAHPYHHSDYDEALFLEYAQHPKCIAVGECGLDYYRLPEDEAQKQREKLAQQEVFKQHIALARKLKLPLIVHIRDANDDSRRLLIENKAEEIGGVLHCYNASRHLLDLSEKGFYFGIGGVLTFKNAKALVDVLPDIPKEKLLVETDAPYLTPTPYRGKRNEPAYTRLVVEKIAEVLDMDFAAVEALLLSNTQRLFKVFSEVNDECSK
jgi:TatD DNase family protein